MTADSRHRAFVIAVATVAIAAVAYTASHRSVVVCRLDSPPAATRAKSHSPTVWRDGVW